ncbi:MAG: hypothetical protein HY077_00425 [Elusimicrobia bacterium]|nr:hypothetical protein [Elusimicrobiota bacterium]
MVNRAVLPAALLLSASLARADAGKNPFVREDWIATVEPDRPTEWGDQWAINNFLLPYRVLQTGKHRLESRYFDNYRFGAETGGLKGAALRVVAGTVPDFGLFMGTQNIHHQTGHDAAGREFIDEYGDGHATRSFRQMLPRYLGGRELRTEDRNPNGRGADANSRANVQPMESENTFAYASAKDLLEGGLVNATAVERYLFLRARFLFDYSETGTLDQHFLDGRNCRFGCAQESGPPFSTDFTQYLYAVNADRYGVARVDQFRLRMGDIKNAIWIQLADPMMWSALYAYGRDYVGRGSNTTRVPMLPVSKDWSYMPSLRVYFSPFGIDYFQDNYFRRKGVLTNVYWMTGDNRYETRRGGGVDVQGIPLPRRGKLGIFLSLHEQPLLARIKSSGNLGSNPLGASELGRTHVAYNLGGSIEIPVWLIDKNGDDPRRVFLYGRGGTKNLSWFPGDYFAGGTYLQLGMGARL